jgi:DNA primase
MLDRNKDTRPMHQDLEQLKQRIALLDYLQQRNWTARRISAREEFVGLCPLHRETRPSFYVNARKNLFYCHGCERGGDLIRFVELAEHLSFRESIAYLQRDLTVAAESELLDQTAAFYQLQLHRHPEAAEYLQQRGLCDPALIEELGLGYAPGGNLRSHLAHLGHSFDLLLRTGLISNQGRDAFCRRVIFPCRQNGRVSNLYGRSLGAAFPHRLLPRSKGGLYAWESVRTFSTVILVEGLFDLAVLWQVGFRNTTCAIGTHLTPAQLSQLADPAPRCVYIVFDQDANHAGQQASLLLAQLLKSRGLKVCIVALPAGQDPNSYFVAGARASDFRACLEQAPAL